MKPQFFLLGTPCPAVAAFAAFIALATVSCARPRESTTAFAAMNTAMTIKSYGRGAAAANEAAQRRILEIERTISATMPGSDVYTLNHAAEYPVQVHAETAELLSFALDMARDTDGAFNPVLYPVTRAWGFTTREYRVPAADEIAALLARTDFTRAHIDGRAVTLAPGMQCDLGAVGKGYAGDEAIRALRAVGVQSAVLDLGGNVQVLGTKPGGVPWNIGVQDPGGGGTALALRVSDCAVVTSGGYERNFTADDGKTYIHILDGRTGYPVQNGVLSTTIVTQSGRYADALSTTAFILGKDAATDFWRARRDFDMILILDDFSLAYTAGLADKITPLAEFSRIEVIE